MFIIMWLGKVDKCLQTGKLERFFCKTVKNRLEQNNLT